MNAPHDLDQLARRMLADYDRHEPGTAFAEGLSLSLDDAYRVQARVAELRAARGERVIGYKVGCTSPVIRKRLGAKHPVFGRLFESECFKSGTSLPTNRFAGLAIEGELAVRLSRDLAPDDLTATAIRASVESVFPVIELHNLVFRREPPSVEELVANNAIHAGFVAAVGRATNSDCDSDELRIRLDGVEIASVSGPQLMQTVFDSIKWLSDELGQREHGLRAGQTVLCGSIADLFPISHGGQLGVETNSFGSVVCSMEDDARA